VPVVVVVVVLDGERDIRVAYRRAMMDQRAVVGDAYTCVIQLGYSLLCRQPVT
jgi:hypothetical protein